jgi:hypothetical protein
MVEFTIPEWLSSLSSNSCRFFKNNCANHKMAERAGSVDSRGLGQLGHAKAISSHGGDWLPWVHTGSVPRRSDHKIWFARSPIALTHLSNIANGNDFVNKSVRLSQDLVYKMLISP